MYGPKLNRSGRTRNNSEPRRRSSSTSPGSRAACGGPTIRGLRPLQGVQLTVYTNPRILPLRAENIPGELKARPQWVAWRAVGDKPDKVPYSARSRRRASSTDLLTWSTFQEALEAYETGEYAYTRRSR